MGKKLAIKGHPTRGKEVIEILEMLGGNDSNAFRCINPNIIYYVLDKHTYWDYIGPEEIDEYYIFTLEEFLEKYPYKVGDKVQVLKSGEVFTIGNMIWDDEVCDIYYYNTDDIEYYNAEEIKLYKETDTVKPVTNKSEKTHEDVIFDSIIWHLRNSVNNGKQNLSGGECEDYFREVVKKNNENKMNDCKKCGLVFGSVRCFDKDCPHNTPKSYAVGLKDGKVIECGVNKEIVMNKIKPLFKTGDVVKLKGCPDKNIFWIVMDVIEDEYIFNSGEKCSFDDQHHYEKTNREVINMTKETFTPAPDITANITDKNNCDIACPDGYEFYDESGNLIGNKVMMRPKKPKYPTTYEECCEIIHSDPNFYIDTHLYSGTLDALYKLLICRTAYWKIAGEEMGLGKPWEPRDAKDKYIIRRTGDTIVKGYNISCVLEFPTAEMRDAFHENFKDLIEQCKDLL